MSAFLMSSQSLADLSSSLEYILNSGFNRFGFEAPESLHKALRDCRDRFSYQSKMIFNALYMLNARAVDGRYRHNPKTGCSAFVPDMPEAHKLITERVYEDYHEKLQPWHYQFCKLLDCLIYQSSEDANRDDPLLHALIDFSGSYKGFLVANNDEYYDAPWG